MYFDTSNLQKKKKKKENHTLSFFIKMTLEHDTALLFTGVTSVIITNTATL